MTSHAPSAPPLSPFPATRTDPWVTSIRTPHSLLITATRHSGFQGTLAVWALELDLELPPVRLYHPIPIIILALNPTTRLTVVLHLRLLPLLAPEKPVGPCIVAPSLRFRRRFSLGPAISSDNLLDFWKI